VTCNSKRFGPGLDTWRMLRVVYDILQETLAEGDKSDQGYYEQFWPLCEAIGILNWQFQALLWFHNFQHSCQERWAIVRKEAIYLLQRKQPMAMCCIDGMFKFSILCLAW